VDPRARREFWEEIHRLAAEGLTVLITTHYMDEAERCHRLAYLAFGELLARGTVAEVVAGAGLTTWIVAGPRLADHFRPRGEMDARAAAAAAALDETPGGAAVRAPRGRALHSRWRFRLRSPRTSSAGRRG
jgi:ABC-2 type transport system ATP-binding protein